MNTLKSVTAIDVALVALILGILVTIAYPNFAPHAPAAHDCGQIKLGPNAGEWILVVNGEYSTLETGGMDAYTTGVSTGKSMHVIVDANNNLRMHYTTKQYEPSAPLMGHVEHVTVGTGHTELYYTPIY